MNEVDIRAVSKSPAVSILIVARNTGALIGDALMSARQQTFADIEVIVIDDSSTDDTRAVAERHAAADTRVRVMTAPQRGLATARNASLAAAQGQWVAILDSDDLLHPTHIERMVAAAERTGAELVTANMIQFTMDDGFTRASLFADGTSWREERYLGLADYIRANDAASDGVVTGYFKPLISLGFLRRHGISYDVRLRIAEDYDLVARALAAGASYLFLPRPTYFYRRHARSTSHRLSAEDLTGMLATAESATRAGDAAVQRAIKRRMCGIRSALAHTRAVDALKAGRVLAAIGALGTDGQAWRALLQSAIEGVSRRLRQYRQRITSERARDPVILIVGGAGDVTSMAIQGDKRAVVHRAAPRDDASRAALADGLPPVARILVAAPATTDDAGYAMAPVIVRETMGYPGGRRSAWPVSAAANG